MPRPHHPLIIFLSHTLCQNNMFDTPFLLRPNTTLVVVGSAKTELFDSVHIQSPSSGSYPEPIIEPLCNISYHALLICYSHTQPTTCLPSFLSCLPNACSNTCRYLSLLLPMFTRNLTAHHAMFVTHDAPSMSVHEYNIYVYLKLLANLCYHTTMAVILACDEAESLGPRRSLHLPYVSGRVYAGDINHEIFWNIREPVQFHSFLFSAQVDGDHVRGASA